MNIGPIEIVVILLVIAAIAAAVVMASRKRRSAQLQERFGPEYERTVEQRGDRRAAESDLADRARRHDKLEIRELEPAQRDRYVAAWRDTQARFVDQPAPAVHEAHVLLTEVMRERGYPVDDFETRSSELSVDHPDVVQNYRDGQRLASASERGEASTEDLRQAMVHFRSLFERLAEPNRGDSGARDARGQEVS